MPKLTALHLDCIEAERVATIGKLVDDVEALHTMSLTVKTCGTSCLCLLIGALVIHMHRRDFTAAQRVRPFLGKSLSQFRRLYKCVYDSLMQSKFDVCGSGKPLKECTLLANFRAVAQIDNPIFPRFVLLPSGTSWVLEKDTRVYYQTRKLCQDMGILR